MVIHNWVRNPYHRGYRCQPHHTDGWETPSSHNRDGATCAGCGVTVRCRLLRALTGFVNRDLNVALDQLAHRQLTHSPEQLEAVVDQQLD